VSDISVPGGSAPESPPPDGRRLVPMQVGSAVVYIEPFEEPAVIQDDGELRPVSVDPRKAFEAASDALRECVRVVGERVTTVGAAATGAAGAVVPDVIGMEFTLTFDVEGRATIVPVLLTGKARSTLGIKVTAEWHPRAVPPKA
jgi:hypothetical protein